MPSTPVDGTFKIEGEFKMKFDDMKATIYAESNGTYYVKISAHECGVRVSGITVKQSPKYGGWWVQMPYYKDYKSGKVKRYIEFDQESPVRVPVEQMCIEAVEAKIRSTPRGYNDNLSTNEELQ